MAKQFDVVIFHGNSAGENGVCINDGRTGCTDGIAAWFVTKMFYETNSLPLPYAYGIGHETNRVLPDIKGKRVLFLDISPNKTELAYLEEFAESFLILDHHITAEDSMQNVNVGNKHFNIEKCGCVLAWEFFFGDIKLPHLLHLIDGIDRWTDERNVYFSEWFYKLPFDYNLYRDAMIGENSAKFLKDGIESAKPAVDKRNREVFEINKKSSSQLLKLVSPNDPNIVQYFMFGTVYCDTHTNFIGEEILKTRDCDFASIIIDMKGGKFKSSCRSNKNHLHVGKFAKEFFNAGGHAGAASFLFKDSDLWKNIIVPNVPHNFADSIEIAEMASIGMVGIFSPHDELIHAIEWGKYLLQYSEMFTEKKVGEMRQSINRLKGIPQTYLSTVRLIYIFERKNDQINGVVVFEEKFARENFSGFQNYLSHHSEVSTNGSEIFFECSLSGWDKIHQKCIKGTHTLRKYI